MSYINFLLSIISTHSLGIFCLILFISAKVLKSDFNLKSKKKMHLFFIPNRNNFYNSSFTLISCLYNYIRIFFFFSSFLRCTYFVSLAMQHVCLFYLLVKSHVCNSFFISSRNHNGVTSISCSLKLL